MASGAFEGHHFGAVRRQLAAAIGDERLRALHRRSPMRAALQIAGTGLWLAVNAGLLARADFGWLWLAALLAQGFALQGVGYRVHEYGVHRGLGGARRSDAFGRLAACLILTPYTRYRLRHRAHHAHTGSDGDEAYKQALDTRWKRFLYLSGPGALWLGRQPPLQPGPVDAKRLRGERRGLWVFASLLAGAGLFAPRVVGLGYLLPLLTSLPLVSSLRVILEHAEADPRNPLRCGTWYRSGPISRLLFAADAGDCHVVHHLFPGIPGYRMAQALRALRPGVLAASVRERTSLLTLLALWFLRCAPHRQPWPRSAFAPSERAAR